MLETTGENHLVNAKTAPTPFGAVRSANGTHGQSGEHPEIAPAGTQNLIRPVGQVSLAARKQLARQCYRMVSESLTKGEFRIFFSFFSPWMKINLKTHTEHNLSAIKHALDLLCEAVLILRQRPAICTKILPGLLRFNSLRAPFGRSRNPPARPKTIPEVDFSCGILTLLTTVKREMAGDRVPRSDNKTLTPLQRG
ncbi:hypothetical protein [Rhizobium herbae]|jgi:hypothetical protein